MLSKNKLMQLSIIASGIVLSFSSMAFQQYDPAKEYKGGSEVTFNNQDYKAQWYANPGQKPIPTLHNLWESPWVKTSENGGSPTPDPVPTPIPKPEPEPDVNPSVHPAYVSGKAYKVGDIASHKGHDYQCHIAPWCSLASAVYAPGEGRAWESAWTRLGGEPEPAHEITQKELDLKEKELTSNPLLLLTRASVRTLDNASVEKISPTSSDNPRNVRRVEGIVNEHKWDLFFPHRDSAYTYQNFLKAVGKFPVLCGDFDDGRDADAICRKTLATMFAHMTQETGEHDIHSDVHPWQQGLHWVREMGLNENAFDMYTGDTCNPNTWQGKAWPCAKDAQGRKLSYFGRGAKQLSYNFNYGAFSQAMFGDVNVLLKEPQRVADTWLNLASAIFFYIYPQSPKPSMQFALDGTWQPNAQDTADGRSHGFGISTLIINGGVECGGSSENIQSVNRISYYKEFAKQLGVPVSDSEVLGCKGMKFFGEGSSGAMPMYWVQDYSYVASNPGGKSYACKLVAAQESTLSALNVGDYARCVKMYFPDVKIIR